MARGRYSIIDRILDLMFPRSCAMCGKRLAIMETDICLVCMLRLPRTYYSKDAYENNMAKRFWVLLPIERAAALFYYESHSPPSYIVYKLKYGGRSEVGKTMGRLAACEFIEDGFFQGIDMIIPIPLSKKRYKKRGYNQSAEIAKGVSSITGLPINDKAVERTSFVKSQTKMHRWMRQDNVRNVFRVVNAEGLKGKHVLIIDDVVTTGSTVLSCGEELVKAGVAKISVMSLGVTR